jgi:hypothetical protein
MGPAASGAVWQQESYGCCDLTRPSQFISAKAERQGWMTSAPFKTAFKCLATGDLSGSRKAATGQWPWFGSAASALQNSPTGIEAPRRGLLERITPADDSFNSNGGRTRLRPVAVPDLRQALNRGGTRAVQSIRMIGGGVSKVSFASSRGASEIDHVVTHGFTVADLKSRCRQCMHSPCRCDVRVAA